MASTNIGVRELKQKAPALVRRAEKGEHIVITRYGKALAVLGPVVATDSSPRMEKWQSERDAFARLLPRLSPRYRGKYVAVHAGRVIDADRNHDRLYGRVARRISEPFFIGAVRVAQKPLSMPGFTFA